VRVVSRYYRQDLSSASLVARFELPLGMLHRVSRKRTTLQVESKGPYIAQFDFATTAIAEHACTHLEKFAFPGRVDLLFAFSNRECADHILTLPSLPFDQVQDLSAEQCARTRAQWIRPQLEYFLRSQSTVSDSANDLSSQQQQQLNSSTSNGLPDARDTEELLACSLSALAAGRLVLDGWQAYDPLLDLVRSGVSRHPHWRITRANEKYDLCSTYPRLLAVPALASDKLLARVAKFRSRGRLPALSYLHPVSGASVTRCSQPCVGLKNTRCKDDEDLVRMIRECNGKAKLYMLDARPRLNAEANRARGGGLTDSANYEQASVKFLDIHNIHVMRNSLRTVHELSRLREGEGGAFLRELDSSNWLQHLGAILGGASLVAGLVEKGSSVLVHCSDGWDRTPQLTSLALTLLDPYYRTLEGLQILIEREWVAFGHKFAQRYGPGDNNPSDKERSPVFLQFLDCVYQLQCQFPCALEYNEHLLHFLLENVYSCRFGTFLFNSEAEQREASAAAKSPSVWSYVAMHRARFINHCYRSPKKGGVSRLLLPSTDLRHLRLWRSHFLGSSRRDESVVSTSEALLLCSALQERIQQLESHQNYLATTMMDLRRCNHLMQEELSSLVGKPVSFTSDGTLIRGSVSLVKARAPSVPIEPAPIRPEQDAMSRIVNAGQTDDDELDDNYHVRQDRSRNAVQRRPTQPRVLSLIDQMLEGMPDPMDEEEGSGTTSLFPTSDGGEEDVGELVDISLDEDLVKEPPVGGVTGWNSASAPKPNDYYDAHPHVSVRATSPPAYTPYGKSRNIRGFAREQLSAEDERDMESLQVLKMGYLHKKGMKRRNWSKRLFVLRYGSLRYYKGTKDGVPKGSIPLTAKTTLESSLRKPNAFVVVNPTRAFLCRAANPTIRQQWMDAIESCIAFHITLSSNASSGSSRHTAEP